MATPAVPAQGDQPDSSGVDEGQDDAVTSTDDAADPAAEGSEGDDDAADTDDDADDDDANLGLSQEEIAAVKADPKLRKLYANLHKGFTQRSQKFASANRLLSALQQDPVGTVQALAQQAGVKLASAPAASAKDDIMEELSGAVGEDLALKLKPLIEKITSNVVGRQIEPLRRDLDVQLTQAVQEQAAMVKETFTKRHPDFGKHEKAMLKIATTVRPAPGADALEYMETLYYLATRKNGGEGDAVTRTRDRMVDAASRGGERPAGGTTGNRVAPSRPDFGKMTKRERLEAAVKAAVRGEKWEE